MINLQLSPYEHKDIITYLQYAREQKINNYYSKRYKFDSTKYDVARIDFLIKVLMSKSERINLRKNIRS